MVDISVGDTPIGATPIVAPSMAVPPTAAPPPRPPGAHQLPPPAPPGPPPAVPVGPIGARHVVEDELHDVGREVFAGGPPSPPRHFVPPIVHPVQLLDVGPGGRVGRRRGAAGRRHHAAAVADVAPVGGGAPFVLTAVPPPGPPQGGRQPTGAIRPGDTPWGQRFRWWHRRWPRIHGARLPWGGRWWPVG